MTAISSIADEGDSTIGKNIKKEAYLMMFENNFFKKAFFNAPR